MAKYGAILLSEMIYGIETATFIIVFLSAVFGVIFWYRRRQETKEYEKLMEDPLEVHFYIPTKTLYVIKYEKQDDKDHTKDELIIPPNFEDYIFLIVRPRLNLYVSDRYFGFGTPDGKRPELSYSNVYTPMQSSDQNVKWYIDLYGCVHIETEKFYLKGETYLPNFKVNTHDKGEYPLEITFNVRSTEYKDVKKEIGKHIVKRLTLKVE